MVYSSLSCTEFMEVLASKAPVPGGGGVAALVGSVGIALCTMVGNFTVGKKKYATVEADIKRLMDRTTKLQAELMALVDEDAKIFEPLSKAYGMPKDTKEQREEKEQVMEKCLRDACEVPMKVMRKCCEVIEMIGEFSSKGSAMVISDAGVAAACCKTALYGASLNVYINTKSMKDRDYANRLNRECDGMLIEYGPMAEAAFNTVLRRVR